MGDIMGRNGVQIDLFLIFFILITPILLPIATEGISEHTSMVPSKGAYTIHGHNVSGEVIIDGNDQLVSFLQEIEAPGSGKKEDPYIIEGWSFNGSDSNCLLIHGSDLHVSISKCRFYDSGYFFWHNDELYGHAIELLSVNNITIDRCIIEDNLATGMRVHSSNITITNNLVRNNGLIGISVSSCRGELTNNTVVDNGDNGLEYNGGMIFENNKLFGNGFRVFEKISDTNTVNGRPILVIQNDLNGSYTGDYAQVILFNCTGTTIHDMNIYNTTVGITAGSDIKIIKSLIKNCKIGIDGRSIVEACTFVGNKIGIQNECFRGNFSCSNSTFINNDIGIHGHNFNMITKNVFSSNRIGISIENVEMKNVRWIMDNEFMDNRDYAIFIWPHYISEENVSIIFGNTISGSEHGIRISGNADFIGNLIENCNTSSIKIDDGHFGRNDVRFYNNTFLDAGLFVSRSPGRVLLDDTTLLNGLPIAWIEDRSNLVIDGFDHSQYIILNSDHITVNGSLIDRKAPLIVIYSHHILLSNITELGSVNDLCGFRIGDSSEITIQNSTFINIDVGGFSENIKLYDNDISGMIFGSDSSIRAIRNNFHRYPLAYWGYWEYSSSFPLTFDDNFYRHFSELNRINGTSSDGIHWDDPCQIIERVEDLHPRVLPFGYTGPMDPMIVSDRTPSEVDEGSNLTFSVEIIDPISVKEVWANVSIDGKAFRFDLDISVEWNWTGDLEVPLNSSELSYTIHAISVLDRWANGTRMNVMVNDVTLPVIQDLSDTEGTTGDTFLFKFRITDNRGIDWVGLVYDHGVLNSVNIELQREGDLFVSTIDISENILGDLTYFVNATDSSGNMAKLSASVNVTDNDPPVAFLPSIINATTGEEVLINGSLSRDNIGIVEYIWYINDKHEWFANEMVLSYTFWTPGVRKVTLEVRDAAGLFDSVEAWVNVTDPIPEEPKERYISIQFGPVYDSDTGSPIGDVTTVLYLDKAYHNLTGLDGIVRFTVTQPEDDLEARLFFMKEGYHNSTLTTTFSPSGSFLVNTAFMDPIKDDVDEGDPPDPDPDYIYVLIIAGILALMIVWIAIFLISGRKDEPEE